MIINTSNPKTSHLNGERGVVLSKGENVANGYGGSIYKIGEVFSFDEEELLPANEFDKYENFYGGENIRVSVDPETGKDKSSLKRPFLPVVP